MRKFFKIALYVVSFLFLTISGFVIYQLYKPLYLYSLNGEKINLRNMKKAVCLFFWHPYCSSCISKFKSLKQFMKILELKGYDLILITEYSAETFYKTTALMAKYDLDDSICYFDKTGSVFEKFYVFQIPLIFLIDKNGNISKIEDINKFLL